MKINTVFPIVCTTNLLANAHVMMKDPPVRRSKYSPYYVQSGLVDYNLLAPINAGYSFPCKGFPPGPPTKTVGRNIQTTLEGSATHGGGHCQFGISYDNVNFVVLKTVLKNCLLSSMSYSFELPPDVPNTKTIVFWSWINAIGNREYYMDCADVNVITNSPGSTASKISGQQLFVANLPGYPTIPEFPRPDMYDGTDLILSRPAFSINVPSDDSPLGAHSSPLSAPPPPPPPSTSAPPPPPSPSAPPSVPQNNDNHKHESNEPSEFSPNDGHTHRERIVPPTPPPSPASTPPPSSNPPCYNGAMKCGINGGFDTCVLGEWIWRACAPGTACKSLSGSVLCDFA